MTQTRTPKDHSSVRQMFRDAFLEELDIITHISRESKRQDAYLSMRIALREMMPVVEGYIDDHEDDPLLRVAVESAMREVQGSPAAYRTGVSVETRKLFASGVSPVYIAAAFAIIVDSVSEPLRKLAIANMTEVLRREEQQFGNPELPYEVITEIIRERSEDALGLLLNT